MIRDYTFFSRPSAGTFIRRSQLPPLTSGGTFLSNSTASLTATATVALALDGLQVGDMIIVDAASPEYALSQVTKVTRTQIVCGRRRFFKANGWPVRGSARYAIRPATVRDVQQTSRAIWARRNASKATEPAGHTCQLVAWFERDRHTDSWDVQTLEQLKGLADWYASPTS
jgi:hypothetical protein